MVRGLKIGCLSCAGLIGLALLFVSVSATAAWLGMRGEQAEERSLPGPMEADRRPGTVELDLYHADVRIAPAGPGEPFGVSTGVDESAYLLEEGFDRDGDGSWTYRLKLHRRGPYFMVIIKQFLGAERPIVWVRLPVDSSLSLDVATERGDAQADLSRLNVREGAFFIDNGSLLLSAKEPLQASMERLRLQFHVGTLTTASLGNASPERLTVNGAVGSLSLDLRGSWQNDAEIHVRSKVASTDLQLPQGVRLEGLGGQRPASPDPELPVPTLLFDIDADNLQIND